MFPNKWKVDHLGATKGICQKDVRAAPLALYWRWRHSRLAIKLRYLGNLVSDIINYYETLSGSYGHFFRIRHEKLRKAPHGGEITMSSYQPCNKTSLSREPNIPDKTFLRNAIGKLWSFFHKPLWLCACSALRRSTGVDVISGWQ